MTPFDFDAELVLYGIRELAPAISRNCPPRHRGGPVSFFSFSSLERLIDYKAWLVYLTV